MSEEGSGIYFSQKLSSPVSTGGEGTRLEHEVGAFYLALLLLNAVPRGLDGGVIKEVRFQQLYAGEPLDDIVATAELPDGDAKLAIQYKRDLAFGEGDKIFDEVLRACWDTFRSSDFKIGRDRMGIGLALYSKTVDEHYQRVLSWARNSTSAENFLERISVERLSSGHQRWFLKLIRGKLDAFSCGRVSDDDVWGFLRSLVILRFDFHVTGSADYHHTVEMLRTILPADQKFRAEGVLGRLDKYAGEAIPTAGSFSAGQLRNRLLAEGISLSPAPNCLDDLQRLNDHAGFILAEIRNDIGGVSLNRSSLVAEAQAALAQHRLLEITGPPGSGKSALLKALVENLQGQGGILVLSGERLEGVGWSGFSSGLQLARRLPEILSALSSSPRPCIFIDGADKISERGAQKIIRDLLTDLKTVPGGKERWSVILTVREENLDSLHSWFDWRNLGAPAAFNVTELEAKEVNLIAARNGYLQPFLGMPHLQPIIRNPFLLNILVDERMLTAETDPEMVATESELCNLWWERVIGANGASGRARQLALLQLGKQVIRKPGWHLVADVSLAGPLFTLEMDRIVRREPNRDVYRFGHDLLEDWVLCRVLDQQRSDLPGYLKEIQQPLGILRAVQLLGCSLLELNDNLNEWLDLLQAVGQDAGIEPRWKHALQIAPLLSTKVEELLGRLAENLLENDGELLEKILLALQAIEVNPNPALLEGAMGLSRDPADFLSMVYSQPHPRSRTWVPMIGWIVRHSDKLPRRLRPLVVQLMMIWQKESHPGSPHRKEVGELAFKWFEEATKRWDPYESE
ncbi:MAG TPA: ATP-binding protein [Blastocatellia bacterium]|nr:ATP-binding protein [Blastocatellia bacterium]